MRWTPRWFNKPKFHIIRHLPDHIRRFGPAILFATENFESFNAVIRTHSIHSNRQAPSRDIARGMAQFNRVRHILSGGYFQFRDISDTANHQEPAEWCTASRAPLMLITPLVSGRNIIAEDLGLLPTKNAISVGEVKLVIEPKLYLLTMCRCSDKGYG